MIIYLVILSAILIIFNVRSRKKEKSNGFSDILKNQEETVTDTTVEILRLRKDLSETIVELQREIVDLKEEVNYLKFKMKQEKLETKESKLSVLDLDEYVQSSEEEKTKYNKKSDKKSEVKNHNVDNKEECKNSSSITEIKKLTKQGLSDDEICKKLSLGKGELLLIKGLYS
ncbi:MAG: DUF6115 domain-containing protein [Sarcina sp.]